MTILTAVFTQSSTDIASTSTFTTTVATTTAPVTVDYGTGPFTLQATDGTYAAWNILLYYYASDGANLYLERPTITTGDLFYLDTSGLVRSVSQPDVRLAVFGGFTSSNVFAFTSGAESSYGASDLDCTLAAGSNELGCNGGILCNSYSEIAFEFNPTAGVCAPTTLVALKSSYNRSGETSSHR